MLLKFKTFQFHFSLVAIQICLIQLRKLVIMVKYLLNQISISDLVADFKDKEININCGLTCLPGLCKVHAQKD